MFKIRSYLVRFRVRIVPMEKSLSIGRFPEWHKLYSKRQLGHQERVLDCLGLRCRTEDEHVYELPE